MSDLTPHEQQTALTVRDPATGHELELATARLGELAETLDHADLMLSAVKRVKSQVSIEVLRRMDLNRKWTATEDGWKLTAPSDELRPEWDVDQLRRTLNDLISEGTISVDAAQAALEPVTELKPRAAGLKALCKNPDLASRIEACRQLVPNVRRYVKATPPTIERIEG